MKDTDLKTQISLFQTIEQTNEFIDAYQFTKETKQFFDFWKTIINMNREMIVLQKKSLQYHTDTYSVIKHLLIEIVCKEKYPEIVTQQS